MSLEGGIFAMGGRTADQIQELANHMNLACYEVSTPAGAEGTDLFSSIRSTLPLDPPIFSDNWDALIDSLDAGIASIEESGAIIVWPDASNLRERSPGDYRIAMASLARVTEHLANAEWTVEPKLLMIFVDAPTEDMSGPQWPFKISNGEKFWH
jgi:hypothetical protein